jgi:hypothetical protein
MRCDFGAHHQFGYCRRGNGSDDHFRRRWQWGRADSPGSLERHSIG